MESRGSTFVIEREDLHVDRTTLVAEGLRIGRLTDSELVLNHPSVSRLHAGIHENDGRFYLFNFSRSSGTTLNGRIVPVEEPEVLAHGDVIQIGPFFIHVGREGDALHLRVTLQFAVKVGEAEGLVEKEAPHAEAAPQAAVPTVGREPDEQGQALNVFWEKRKREAGKVARLSPLRPHAPARVLGKIRFNWSPTRDLVRPWPFSVFIWATLIVGALSAAAAFWYAEAFSPAPLSSPHARATLAEQPPLAREANAGSCTTCHSMTASMETGCASCHKTEAFTATVIEPHARAGIGCVECHAEHRGADFSPLLTSMKACVDCHNDANRETYNGRRVGTPHGGTLGYPVGEGRWVWSGLTEREWERKSPELRQQLASMKEQAQTGGQGGFESFRSAEFHLLHLHRVKVAGQLPGNEDGETTCSSCHQSFSPIDRETPAKTCAVCHSGDKAGQFQRVLADNAPNCISCHAQHVEGRRRWGTQFLVRGDGAGDSPGG